MTQYYVATTGSNSNDGLSAGAPWLTLQYAAANISGGDTVDVADGTYSITSYIWIIDSGTDDTHRTTFRSTNLHGAVLVNNITPTNNDSHDAVFLVNANFVDIIGFEITGPNGRVGIRGWGEERTGSGSPAGAYIRVLQCYVHDIGQNLPTTSLVFGLIMGQYRSDDPYKGGYNVVDRCKVVNIGYEGGPGSGGIGVGSSNQAIYFSTHHGTITNNIVAICAGNGIKCFHYPHHMTIANNLVINTGWGTNDSTGGIILSAGGTNFVFGTDEPFDYSVIENNIVVGCHGQAGIYEDGGGHSPVSEVVGNNTFRNNCYYNNSCLLSNTSQLDSGATDTNMVVADPHFVNYQDDGTGDYHLQGNSPCISAGTGAGGAPSIDYDGNSRPQGATFDIGPYEYIYGFSDSFTRTVAAGSLGTADTGQTYSTYDSTLWSVTGSNAQAITASPTGYPTASPIGYTIANIGTHVKTKLGAGSTNQVALAVRDQSYLLQNCYRLIMTTTQLQLQKVVTNTPTVLQSISQTHDASLWYHLELRANLANIAGKCWLDGDAEPATWQVVGTDTQWDSGRLSIRGTCSTAGVAVLFDDWSATTLPAERIVAGISASLQTVSTARTVTNVSAATKVLGVVRSMVSVKASVGLPTMAGALAVSISGAYAPLVQQAGISFDQRIDAAAGGSFVLDDATGATFPVQERQQVGIEDTTRDLILYRGFIDKIDEQRIGNTPRIRRTITLTDLRALAEKRLCQQDYTGWTAGNIACDLVRTSLAGEQITANYALRRDHDASSFGQGTLTNVRATNGYLELARSGSDVTQTEDTTAEFASGSLSSVTATNNTLQLQSYTALRMTGTCGVNVGVNKGNYYSYYSIWTGSVTVNAAWEYLEYYVWMPSTSTKLTGGIDLVCSDGTTLRDKHALDQQGIDCHPGAELQGWADDQWLYRKIYLPVSLVGKTVTRAMIALESDTPGSYCFYVRSAYWKAANGSAKVSVFATGFTSLQKCTRVSQVGYYNVSLKVVTAYAERGYRVSPALSLNSVGLAGNSHATWAAILPTQPTSSNTSSSNTSGSGSESGEQTQQQVLIETSIDGGDTYQACTTQGASIPTLPVGMSLSGKSLLVRQTLAIAGPNPELTPILTKSSVTVESAYNATKSDVARSYTGSEMTDGTNTQCGYQTAINTADGWQRNDVSGLKQNGYRKNWRTGELTDMTSYGVSGDALMFVQGGTLAIRSNGAYGAHVSFDNAGSYDAIIAECDVCLHTAWNAGILYRTTYWGNASESFGYFAYIEQDAIGLGRGTNNITGGWTNVYSVAATLDPDTWYHLKVVCGTDDVHHIFVDDIEYISYTSATYSSSGEVGLRMYTLAGGLSVALFDNFGVSSNTSLSDGVRTAPDASLASASHVGDSRIWWDPVEPAGTSLTVRTSLDGGSNYTDCTNGAPIPGLTAGLDLTTKSLRVRTILHSDSITHTATLRGISWLVSGAFSASGNRVSPVLDADAAGTVGSSSATWDATIPASGTLGIDSSLNGSSWNALSASGDSVVGLTEQGDVWWDTFDTDTHTSYSYTSGHWTWDSANSRLVTAGTSDLLHHGTFSARDGDVTAIVSRADGLELILRNSASGRYMLRCYDNSGGTPHTLSLRKWTSGGGDVQLASTSSLDFARGTYRTLTFSLRDGNLAASFDGTLLLTYDDTSPLAGSGEFGLSHPGTVNYVHDLALRPLGQDATGVNVYTRARLTSTDPLTSPIVRDLVACVRSPLIATGQVIPQTKDWAYKQSVAGALDEIAASMSWRFNESYQLVMRPRDGEIAPFVLATSSENIEASTPPKVQRSSPEYRNRQYVTGAIDLIEWPESKLGNGVDTSWVLAYPIDSITSIQMNGQAQSFGVKDTDTGKTFYYTPGEVTLSLAEGIAAPTSQIDIISIGRAPYTAMSEDTDQQAILADLEGATGIYERSEDIAGLSKEAADALAIARIMQYARLSLNWTATTRMSGLAPGQLLTVIVPEHGLNDLQFLITSVSTQIKMQGESTLLYWYDVEATTGPSLGGWARALSAQVLKKGGSS